MYNVIFYQVVSFDDTSFFQLNHGSVVAHSWLIHGSFMGESSLILVGKISVNTRSWENEIV